MDVQVPMTTRIMQSRRRRMKLATTVLLCAATALSGWFAVNSAQAADAPKARPAVPVAVAQSVAQDVPIDVTAIGTAEAFSIVSIKPQIAGIITEKHFIAGQHVEKGQLLYKLDSRPFEATLNRTQADLDRQKALLANAQSEADRKKHLLAEHAASQWEYDQSANNAKAQAAVVAADEAMIAQAKLDINYCTIVSPIDGYLGPTLTDAGNVVKANETELIVVRQVTPIYVEVAVPEQYLPQIRKAKADGDIPMRVTIPSGAEETPGKPIEGKLLFINNTVNEDSGTITLRGYFENTDRELWPGQYVNVSVVLGQHKGAVLVPATAVQASQEGTFVYVVQKDNTVKVQPVKAGDRRGDDIIITSGLDPNVTVVTDGQLRLTPGAEVEIMSRDGKAVQDKSDAADDKSASGDKTTSKPAEQENAR